MTIKSFIHLKSFKNQPIRMISEGQDWSNDAEYSVLHHTNKLHFKQFLEIVKSFHNTTDLNVFFVQPW